MGWISDLLEWVVLLMIACPVVNEIPLIQFKLPLRPPFLYHVNYRGQLGNQGSQIAVGDENEIVGKREETGSVTPSEWPPRLWLPQSAHVSHYKESLRNQ